MEKYTVIGAPVHHSVSPTIHNAVFSHLHVPFKYDTSYVPLDQLHLFVEQFKRNNGRGFNITIPHKQNIIPFLDKFTDEARIIGAVNTVTNDEGCLTGHNTDVDGFLHLLHDEGISVANRTIKILGAGGTARAVAYAMHKAAAHSVVIYNRTLEKAQDICTMVESSTNMTAKPLDDFFPGDCDIIINTTSVGLHPNSNLSPVKSLDGMSLDTVLVDVIYSPPITTLMTMAQERGCKTVNGLKMLIYQGLLADEIWLNKKIADDKDLFQIIYKLLAKRRH